MRAAVTKEKGNSKCSKADCRTGKNRKTTGTKNKRGTREVEQEYIDESEASQNEELDCIEVRKQNQ